MTKFICESHSADNSLGYLGEVFSVEFWLLKATLCVIFHWSDNKTTTQKQHCVRVMVQNTIVVFHEAKNKHKSF